MAKWRGKERDVNLFSLPYIWMKGKEGRGLESDQK